MTWQAVIKRTNTADVLPDVPRIEKTDEQWRQYLSVEQFHIMRQHGTEQAFSGAYCEAHLTGTYACGACHTPLFEATEKFDSGTGWPSFTTPLEDSRIQYRKDTTYGMIWVEVCCNICDSHLGHVFPDGPEPSGLRYCINSIALELL